MGEGWDLGRAPLAERLRLAPVEHAVAKVEAAARRAARRTDFFVDRDFAPTENLRQ